MKKRLMAILLSIVAATALIPGTASSAMPLPDSAPSITNIFIYRNVLQPNDMFAFILENTPYASTANLSGYSQTYIWNFEALDGTNLGATTGYDFFNNGYGQNIIGFYWDNATAPAWMGSYQLQLKGNPLFFANPQVYTFPVPIAAFTAPTVNVSIAVSSKVLDFASYLDTNWALSSASFLLGANGYLSAQGESFFNGAVLGIQSLAPYAYSVIISAINAADRTWGNTYVTALSNMYAGTYLAPAIASGEAFFNVNYNLLGLLLSLAVFVTIIVANWMVGGGDFMRCLIECAGPFVILVRLNMIDFSTGAFIVALCWLYSSARLWRIV